MTDTTQLRQREGDQPLPVPQPDLIGSHQWVIDYLHTRKNMATAPGLFDVIVKALKDRAELGIKRYGSLLQPNNGRDSLQDAMEETTDQVVYLANALREGEQVHMIFERAVEVMIELAWYMECTEADFDNSVGDGPNDDGG